MGYIKWGMVFSDKREVVPDSKVEEKASRCLVNISDEEVNRRYIISLVGFVLFAVALSAFVLGEFSRIWRILLFFPIGLALGYGGSAQQGI
eukprot:TRINITY_DN96356_c0_g1_i1.p1 TRINITY_DN96356_c0_g1~~TRINITY_DN96356_c0_g1_i1.p1  ORF type:complete len:91 (+),score=18.58 TRINITY_DN96356_c0_g1_i1:1-273(+)